MKNVRSLTFIGLAFTSQAFFFLLVLSPTRSTKYEKRKIIMGEAFIWYRGRGDNVDPELLKPQTITTNTTYEAPVNGVYRVSCVGGGGGGGGGCRNAWNTSQVFYGSAGTRGTLSTGNVTLNKGDKVTITVGAGGTAGTNNTSPLVYSNGWTNSRGTNGTSGGATSFGSYVSGSGGTYGYWSWSARVWTNTQNWSNTWAWNNVRKWNNNCTYVRAYNVSSWVWCNGFWWTTSSWNVWYPEHLIFMNYATWWGSYWQNNITHNNGSIITTTTAASLVSTWSNSAYNVCWENRCPAPAGASMQYYYSWSNTNWYNWYNNYELKNTFLGWWNRYTNYSTRCYTSIQLGSWWYLNNNNVTTSGTRIYSGDGGNSGRPGNSGYVLIIPPQSA